MTLTAALPDLADIINEIFRAAHRPGARNANNPAGAVYSPDAQETAGGWKPSTHKTPRAPKEVYPCP